jgi:S-adenosylmethionine hydrolase
VAFITLISDYGHNNPYLATLKGVIYSALPDIQIIDISHAVNPHDVLQAAYLLKNTIKNFPKGTVHIIAIDTSFELHKQFLIVEYKQQFFISADNGIFSLIFDHEPDKIWAIKDNFISPNDLFPEKNVFVDIAVKLIRKEDFQSFSIHSEIRNMKQNIAPVVEENLIRGSIIFIDGYGNAITNITKELFSQKMENKNTFAIFYRRKDKINYISKNYSDVKNGYELALFNESGLLEIAMNTGKAAQLLGLREGSQVIIEFYD